MRNKNRILPCLFSLFILGVNVSPTYELSNQVITKYADDEVEVLNVYNWEDYIDEGDEEEGIPSLIEEFENKMLEEEGRRVSVVYSTFDTNETMLSELQTGKSSYDLICPSDYVIQKMIAEDLIQPYDDGSTPNYDKYVSPFVADKIDNIEVNGEKGIVSRYARGYMWGTLGLLYNPTFSGLEAKGITEDEMQEDMKDWLSLWDDKYSNLLAIKDSMRDTYAVGIMKTYNDDFELDGQNYEGFKTIKEKYLQGIYDEDTYNEKVSEIFNLNDSTTITRVGNDLQDLKNNAYGFEVDSGKTDMARGMYFAINVAWSGDAAWAMDMADENNENSTDPNYHETILKYAIPETGANIWFDGWVIPKNSQHKDLAQKFVDFLSTPQYAARNMNYIGYTPVIAGDEILDLVQSWYDLRYDEDSLSLDSSYLDGLTLVTKDEIDSLPEEEKEDKYYMKDISYFFEGTLENKDISDSIFAIGASEKDRQFDTQYPDSSLLPGLAVMADFGSQNADLLLMWENVKNTPLPLYAYILVLVAVVAIIIFYIVYKISKHNVKERRKARKEMRKDSSNAKKLLTEKL